jgi:hypothetical protein
MLNIKEENVNDIHCPKCNSEYIDWDHCCFREYLDRDTAVFDADMYCIKCGHKWEAILDFKLCTMSYYTSKDEKVEQNIEGDS